MQLKAVCPNCNSDHIVPDGRHFEGVRVLFCTDCTSWFTIFKKPVLFESDGGDDIPDEEVNRQLRSELEEDDDDF